MGPTWTSELIQEHQKILGHLKNLREAWSNRDSTAFRQSAGKLSEELEQHHQHEMNLIFRPMEHQKRLREGGPFCTYFFDFRMNFQPIHTVETDLRKQGFNEFKIQIPNDLQSYFNDNSPLTIPLEEHLAIHTWAHALAALPAQLTDAQTEWVEQVLPRLQDLIEANMQKEERCLFAFATQLLHAG